MGRFSSKPADDKAAQDKAVAEYKKAKKALDANSERERKAGIRDETPEYLRLNAAVNEALENQSLPWWRR